MSGIIKNRIAGKITLLYMLLISSACCSIDELKVYDSLAFNEMVCFKIVSFDTIPGFTNFHTRTTQYEYSQIFCTHLKNGFNAKTAYEILDANSRIRPHVNLHIAFRDLYTDTREHKEKRPFYTSCTIEIIGTSIDRNTPVFSATSRRRSRSDDLEDELRDNIIEIARDTYDEFKDLRRAKIKKTFQYYDFKCSDFTRMHYIFSRVPNIRALQLLYDVADAEIQNEIVFHKFPLERFYLRKTDSIVIDESINFHYRNGVISENLKKYLLGRGVTSFLIIHSLNCDLPYDEMNFSRERVAKFFYPNIQSRIITSFIPSNINDVDNAFCKMFLLDVQQNRCLISTQIYGNDGEDIAENILDAIGYFNEKAVEVEPCLEH